MCRLILAKLPNIKFHENSSSGSSLVTCKQTVSQTDMPKTSGAFLQLLIAIAPKELWA
jgi:hypothetical protein